MLLSSSRLNSNTIPVTTWGMIELARDPALFQIVREEVLSTYVTDPASGKRIIDAQKLVLLPVLQAVYIELMRLHVSINITREVMEPITMGGYKLEKGVLLQAPTEVAHYDERIWSVEDHPASEFWPGRHLEYETTRDVDGKETVTPKFVMTGRSNNFIPYGELRRRG